MPAAMRPSAMPVAPAGSQGARLTCVNGGGSSLRTLRVELLRSSFSSRAAPQGRGASGTLARFPVRFAVAAFSFLHAI
jgi:hypothetical protein